MPNVNTIPGEDVFYMDMRILPRYPVKDVLSEVERIIKRLEGETGKTGENKVKISYEVVQSVQSKPTSTEAPLVRSLASAIEEVLGIKPRPIGIGGGTAGAALRNIGIDCAVWSKLDDTAHMPNEYAVLDNILDGAKVMAALALQF